MLAAFVIPMVEIQVQQLDGRPTGILLEDENDLAEDLQSGKSHIVAAVRQHLHGLDGEDATIVGALDAPAEHGQAETDGLTDVIDLVGAKAVEQFQLNKRRSVNGSLLIPSSYHLVNLVDRGDLRHER